MHKRTFKLGSYAVCFLLGVIGAYFVYRAVVRRKAEPAARIAGGSMAPALVGDRFRLACADCGFRFSYGVESPPDRDRATCPNCGFPENDVSDLAPVRGQRVRIDRMLWRSGELRRWDVVAVRRNNQPANFAVKRLVGLPGERLSIRGGEVYVDERLLRKSLDEFRRVAVLVHDDSHRPTGNGDLPRRWVSELPGAWVDLSDGGAAGFRRICEPSEHETETRAWLVYHNWPGLPPPSPRTSATPVMDHLGYNQAASRSLNEVRDLMLQFDVVPKCGSVLAMRYDDGTHRWEVRLTASDDPAPDNIHMGHLVKLERDEQPAWLDLVPLVIGRPNRIEFAHVDAQMFLAINGKIVVSYDYELPAEETARKRRVTEPFAVGATGHGIEISRLRVYRDLYYLHPWGNNAEWSMDNKLGKDEIFLLGDNPFASDDSRNWIPHGVRLRDVAGYVRPLASEE